MFPLPLRRDVAIALAVKAVLLTLLYLLFFSGGHRVAPSPAAMQAHLLAPRAP